MLEAIDVMPKSAMVFNACFPLEARVVWTSAQHFRYNLRTKTVSKSTYWCDNSVLLSFEEA